MRLDQTFNPERLGGDPNANPASEPMTTGAAGGAGAAAAKKPTLDQSMLCLLLMMAVAGGGLYSMHVRTRPAAADAAALTDNEARIKGFMSGGQQQLANIDQALRETNRLIESLRVKPAARVASAELAGGDPFGYAPLNPPADPNATAPPQQPQQFVSREQREQARQQAFESARKLRLQSILHGSSRRACMINDKLYFEGQTVDVFVVDKITRDEVTIRSGEFPFRLRMAR